MKVKCPRCQKELIWEKTPTRPFCSDRCRLIDLGAWADGKYTVPDEHSEPEASSPEESEEEPDKT